MKEFTKNKSFVVFILLLYLHASNLTYPLFRFSPLFLQGNWFPSTQHSCFLSITYCLNRKMVRTTLTSLAIPEKISMSFPGIFSVRAVSSRFLAARSHRSALWSFKFRDILSENVAGSKSRYQVIEFTLIVVLSIAIGFVLFAQGDTV